MLELTLFAILIVLVLIFLLLRSWLPLFSKFRNFNNDTNEQLIEGVITIRKKEINNEKISFTLIGLSKKFDTDVLFEASYVLGKKEDSKFYYAELNVMTYENSEYLINENEGFLVTINCFEKGVNAISNIYLICSENAYQFLKKSIQTNELMTLSVVNGKKISTSGMKDFKIKGRNVEVNLENSEESISSLRRFVKRYKSNPSELRDSYLSDWLNSYIDKIETL